MPGGGMEDGGAAIPAGGTGGGIGAAAACIGLPHWGQ